MSAPYPHLVVRIYSAVYNREEITIEQGPPDVHVGFRSTYVHHPDPFTRDGEISPGCKDLLVTGVTEAAQRLGFSMCLVWGPASSTYCERDGSSQDSNSRPSGGLGSGGVGGQPMPIDIQFDKREPQKTK